MDLAKKLGADATLLVKKEDAESHILKRIIELVGEEPDKTIDACGAQSMIRLAILVSLSFLRSRIYLLFLIDMNHC